MEPNGSGGEVDGGKEIPGGWRSPGIRRELVDLAKRYERRGEARMAPAMISAPGHRASRRRQREALPAWCYRGAASSGAVKSADNRPRLGANVAPRKR
jgi:hypothetical protein